MVLFTNIMERVHASVGPRTHDDAVQQAFVQFSGLKCDPVGEDAPRWKIRVKRR